VSKAIPEQTVKLGSETLNLQFPAPEKVRLRITIAFAPEEDDSLGSILEEEKRLKAVLVSTRIVRVFYGLNTMSFISLSVRI
jgi:hypothetical protein